LLLVNIQANNNNNQKSFFRLQRYIISTKFGKKKSVLPNLVADVTQKGSTFASKIETTITSTSNDKIKNLKQKTAIKRKGTTMKTIRKTTSTLSVAATTMTACDAPFPIQ